eukprot:gene2228-2794_t
MGHLPSQARNPTNKFRLAALLGDTWVGPSTPTRKRRYDMAFFMSSRKKSTLQGIEQEIEQLRSGIERIKHVVEAESQHSLSAIQDGALRTLSRSRDLA